MSEDQDWRLQAKLDAADAHRALDRVIGALRGPDVVKGSGTPLPHDVVLTHDGSRLFAYAADEATLKAARAAIEEALQLDGVQAGLRISHWEDERDAWIQVDPPPSAEDERLLEAAERDGEAVETRTMVASAGKLIRSSFEQTMLGWAGKLGLQCTIVEHRHLLTTQVAFTVTGPKRRIDEFAQGLKAEEVMTIRTERTVMLSPL